MSYQRGAYGHGDYKGWQTTSDDYYAHVARMERMPSTIVEAPKFPNFHTLFNNKKILNTTTTTDHVDVHEEVVVQKEEPSETAKSSTVQVPPEKKVVQLEKQIKDSTSTTNNDPTPVSTVQVPVAQKKVVQFEEQNKDSKITEKKNGKKQRDYKSNIDVEATDFILNKHKNFELCKWMSLRGY